MKSLLPLSLVLVFYAGMNHASAIQPVLDPITGVTATSPDEEIGTPTLLVNNSGLQAGGSMVLGASDSLAEANADTNFYTDAGEAITFDLQQTYHVTDLLVWNDTQNQYQNYGADSVEILSSTTGTPGSFTLDDTVTFNEVPFNTTFDGTYTVPAQDVSVSIDAKYIQLLLVSNYSVADSETNGPSTLTGLNEVHFVGTEDLPEPSTYAMLALGLVGLVALRRKRAYFSL
jgi:hypothetical protein